MCARVDVSRAARRGLLEPSPLAGCLGVLLWFLFPAALGAAAEPEPPASAVRSPLSPEESLAHFRLPAGLRIELVASEPAVIDPVAIRFDEEGRLWVVEMSDYPTGATADGRTSRIRRLEDRDRDGRYESAAVFAEGLSFATGIQPYRGGLIATVSGKIVYLRDADGDGRAEPGEEWFAGLAEENSQLRANHPRWAVDGRVYVANGLRGGNVVDLRNPSRKPLSIAGRDLRFDPATGKCEAVSGHGQFGLTFDDFGRRFVCSNRNPLQHVVIEDRYLARSPLAAVPAVVQDVAAAAEASQVYAISRAFTTSILHAGQFTAACGVEIYRGGALPAPFAGAAFTCEPTGNLVHCEIMRPRGATFQSQPSQPGVEFLASDDTWFRPVNLEVGPDGALYVVDMYRAVIEHPQWMPDELRQRPDTRWGDDAGRIYRIVAEGAPAAGPAPRLSHSPTSALVELLGHENAWWRETAARLLDERQDRGAVKDLENIVRSAPRSAARFHALWALSSLGALSNDLLASAVADAAPPVRESALLLAEPRLADVPALRAAVLRLAGDADPRVRFQMALSIGAAPGDDAIEPLAAVALAGIEDPWTRRAVAIAAGRSPAELDALRRTSTTQAPGRAAKLVDRLLAMPGGGDTATRDAARLLVRELSAVAGRESAAADLAVLLAAAGHAGRSAAPHTLGLAAIAAYAGAVPQRNAREMLFGTASPLDSAARKTAAALLAVADQRAADSGQDMVVRLDAIELLRHAGDERSRDLLRQLALDGAQEVRLAAIAALGATPDDKLAPLLLSDFERKSPAERRAIIGVLSGPPVLAQELLAALAAGRLSRAELDPISSAALAKHADPQVRARAAAVLQVSVPAERAKVLAAYARALQVAGDARRGKLVFQKNCGTCHRVGGVGVDVGPSIADSRDKTPAQLLTDILEPSRAIDNNFLAYNVVTTDGRLLTGTIAAESAAAITLRAAEAQTHVLPRSEIESVQSTGLSLMPEGLERSITIDEMADVIAFVKGWRYLDDPAIPADRALPGR